MSQEELIIIVRILGAVVIGALIGFERTFHGRPAGFRTHALVCVASTLLMIVTVYQNESMTALVRVCLQVKIAAVRLNTNRLAQVGAAAALRDEDWLRLVAGLRTNGEP